jgi:sulfur relay (sulfurtransferase) DsrC/TusE family protein
MEYDVFISHASEDKSDVALPLARHLQKLGLKVWLDEFELTLGDSLRRNIDHGLAQSKFGVVVLSPAFFSKEWPNKELDGLVAREGGKDKVILPVWHNVGTAEIVKYSPILADKMAVSTTRGLDYAAERIFEAVKKSIAETVFASKSYDWTDSERETLSRLGQQALTATSHHQLKFTLYELEEYMEKYPHSPEARMLKDRIETAMLRSEPASSPATIDYQRMERRVGLFPKIVICILILMGIVALYFFLFK